MAEDSDHICFCGKAGNRVCLICGVQPYCSRRCQIDDWTDHQDKCRKRYPDDPTGGGEGGGSPTAPTIVDVAVSLQRSTLRSRPGDDPESSEGRPISTRTSFDEFILSSAGSVQTSTPNILRQNSMKPGSGGFHLNNSSPVEEVNSAFEEQLQEVSELIKRDKFREALRRGEALIKRAQSEFSVPPTSPRLSPLLVSLGIAYCNVSEYPAAERCYKQALEVADPSEPGVSTWLITFYLNRSQVEQADNYCKIYYDKALTILGETHPATVSILRLKGQILLQQERHSEACEIFERCYTLLSAERELADAELQDLVRDLINTLLFTKKLPRAHEVALSNYTSLQGCRTVSYEAAADFALSGLKLAQILMGMNGDLTRAYALLTEALAGCEATFGKESLQVAEVLVSMAQVRKRRGQFDEETVELLNRAHDCYEANDGPDGPNTKFTLSTIQRVRKELYKSKFDSPVGQKTTSTGTGTSTSAGQGKK